MKNTIILGTRGSKLALIQTDIIKNKLIAAYPKLKIEIKIINTRGDKDKKSPIPLDTIGKDWFSKELDNELLKGTIDVAVHSLKDLSEELPAELMIAAIPEREDPREALIAKNNIFFDNLPNGATIGTDSTRRKAQILHKRPDLFVKSIRGNVDGRLKKLERGEYDAIFLAVAGLKRLGLENTITEYFSATDIIPSPGQGALAVVIRKDNRILLNVLKKLNHRPTVNTVKAERSFSKIFGGGCSMPIGAYAVGMDKTITLIGMVGSLDGKHVIKDSIKGSISSPIKLGKTLGVRMKKKSASWYTSNETPYVLVTSPTKEKNYLTKNIKKLGLQPLFYPTIEIKKNSLSKNDQEYMKNLEMFDWIVFTSKSGVNFFMQALTDLDISVFNSKKTKIAVVGEKTANSLASYGFPVSFKPAHFTAKNVSTDIKNVSGKKILFVQGNLSTAEIKEEFKKKGAETVSIVFYKTELVNGVNENIKKLFYQQKIEYLTFTSPSTVRGLLKNIKNANVYSIPAVAIGPTTTKELTRNGFKKIYTADTYTEEGMLIKLKEILV